jgi:hypothetical protein
MSTDWKPVPKIVAAGLGGAVATLLVWLLSELAGRDMPAEAGAALAAVLAFAFGYLKGPAEEDGDRGAVDVVTLLVILLLVVVILAVAGVL